VEKSTPNFCATEEGLETNRSRVRIPSGHAEIRGNFATTWHGWPLARWKKASSHQGCQMVYFQTEEPNLGKFWRPLESKKVGILFGHLVNITATWKILRSLGMYISWPFGYLVAIWYIFPRYIVSRKIWQPWNFRTPPKLLEKVVHPLKHFAHGQCVDGFFLSHAKMHLAWPEWPNWANFRQLGVCLVRVVFKLTEVAQIFRVLLHK
jgi:hypothetical protein